MRKTFIAIALLLSIHYSFGQSFMHGAGITIIGSTTGEGISSDVGLGFGFTYAPRFNFFETKTLSVSVGIPLSIGISAITSTTYYQNGVYEARPVGFVINAPLLVSLNMGRGSSKENRQKFGYFFGAGFSFYHGDFLTDNYNTNTSSYTNSYSSNTYGPAGNAGVRFGVGRKYRNIEVRLSYMKGVNENKPNIFAVAGLFNF